MPIKHCSKCHHEWEGHENICDWCGAEGYIIQKKSELEKFLEQDLKVIIKEVINEKNS